MTRAHVVVVVGALLLGGAIDHAVFSGKLTAPKQQRQQQPPAQDQTACVVSRDQFLAALRERVTEGCAPCPSAPSASGVPIAEQPGDARAELADCRRSRSKLGAQLLGCVGATSYDPGNLPRAGGDPQRTYDVAVYVRLANGSIRLYPAGEWPDGKTEGYVYAKQAKGLAGKMGGWLWAPTDGGPWPDEAPSAAPVFADAP